MNNSYKVDIRKIIILASVVFVVGLIIISIIDLQKTATVNIEVAPVSSKTTLNGKTYSNGTHKIKPGVYNVSITKDSFQTHTEEISIQKGETKEIYIGLIQNDGSYSWYVDHPEDDRKLTEIGDKNASITQKNLKKTYPILEYIPYTDQSNGIKYSIDVQYKSNNVMDYISVVLNTCSETSIAEYRQEADKWLKSKDSNIKKYTIKYSSLCGNLD